MQYLDQHKLGKNNEYTKRANRETILNFIRANETLTRAELVKLTSLTSQSISKIIAGLEKSNLINAQEKIFGRKGQPPLPYSLRDDAGFGIGIQLENDVILGALVDFTGRSLARVEHPHKEADADGLFAVLHSTITELLSQSQIPQSRFWGVCLAMPKLSNIALEDRSSLENPFWENYTAFELEAKLSAKFERPIFVENDANAGALGEYYFGAAQNIENFCYLYIGEGLGCGIFSEGGLFRGAGGNAGELGRITVPIAGASGNVESILNHHSIRDHDNQQNADVMRWLVGMMENSYDPSSIILGGDAEPENLQALIQATLPLYPSIAARRHKKNPRLQISPLGKNAVILGAAMIPILGTLAAAPDEEWNYFGKISDVYVD